MRPAIVPTLLLVLFPAILDPGLASLPLKDAAQLYAVVSDAVNASLGRATQSHLRGASGERSPFAT